MQHVIYDYLASIENSAFHACWHKVIRWLRSPERVIDFYFSQSVLIQVNRTLKLNSHSRDLKNLFMQIEIFDWCLKFKKLSISCQHKQQETPTTAFHVIEQYFRFLWELMFSIASKKIVPAPELFCCKSDQLFPCWSILCRRPNYERLALGIHIAKVSKESKL